MQTTLELFCFCELQKQRTCPCCRCTCASKRLYVTPSTLHHEAAWSGVQLLCGPIPAMRILSNSSFSKKEARKKWQHGMLAFAE
jgi:hypothetical protein